MLVLPVGRCSRNALLRLREWFLTKLDYNEYKKTLHLPTIPIRLPYRTISGILFVIEHTVH